MNLHEIKRLKVLGKEYKLVWYDSHPVPTEDLNLYGKCEWATSTIYINQTLDMDRTLDTLIHETIHAIRAEMDVTLQERDIIGLASGLQCFLKDNFHLKLKPWVKLSEEK